MDKRGLEVMIDAVIESGTRAARIVDNMLSFSRRSESKPEKHNLAELLDKTVELASNDYDLKKKYDFRKIEILREYEKGLPDISCEGSQLQQVFLNLLKNGAQAMASFVPPGEKPRLTLRIRRNEGHVDIQIEDNGPGMDETARKRALEPFFTTKSVGVGTGLGLSVSYFIITENHNGSMRVDSKPGQGSKFTITLPIES
jgi:signal transduction histidine kinase